ncbi:hypothetical protein HELRODRAFT_116074 [Helobdella robusta]|uniref:Cyclin A n=1 Tax=Helobdella robusta TaxID=6412 RepID=T1EGC7_HELRO|nr:hypothetical protein HELRODRAFT_116074 [Helobdella robusta]ESN92226.1 hypothetical protein HELRODRAFT_116074 [Helobdella robusta]
MHRHHHLVATAAASTTASTAINNKKFKAFGEITNIVQQQSNNVSNSNINVDLTAGNRVTAANSRSFKSNNNASSISNSSSIGRSHYDIYDDDDDDDDNDIPSTFNDLDISFEGRRMSSTTIFEHHQQQQQKQHIPTEVAARQHRRSLINQQIALLDVYSLPEYRDDILTYGKEAEQRYMAKANYMERQSDINHSMRSILVDWLVEVADEYKLKRETFFLAVNYIDRFLSMMSVIRCRLQLLGAAAMFIAAKYEEIYPPDVAEFVYITDDTYTMKQVLQMEQAILKTLNFLVAAPTPNYFCCDLLDRLGAYKKGPNGVCDDGGRWNSLAMYMLETTTVFGDCFLKFSPSMISTSCVALSHYLINMTGCMSELSRITSYTVFSLSECLNSIFTTLHNSPNVPQQALRVKYNSEKYHFVASLELPETLPLDLL